MGPSQGRGLSRGLSLGLDRGQTRRDVMVNEDDKLTKEVAAVCSKVQALVNENRAHSQRVIALLNECIEDLDGVMKMAARDDDA